MDSISYVYIFWTMHGMSITYITFEREGTKFSNTTDRALAYLHHTQRHSTVGRTPLDEWSARRRDLYLTTHNTHNRQPFMPPVRFEPKTPAVVRPQTYALDRAATGDRHKMLINNIFMDNCNSSHLFLPQWSQILTKGKWSLYFLLHSSAMPSFYCLYFSCRFFVLILFHLFL
jgi:hypothetical protein